MKFVNNSDFTLADFTMAAADAIVKRKEQMPPIFIDIRESAEYHKGHLAGATLLPADFLEDHLMQLPPFAHIIVYGDADDQRVAKAIETLASNGFKELSYVEGGLPALIQTIRDDENEVFLADLPKEEWMPKIDAILSEKVRPALASDGGGLEVVRLENDQLFINYHGACSGCSSSTTGTLRFIQSVLRVSLNHDLEVVPVEA